MQAVPNAPLTARKSARPAFSTTRRRRAVVGRFADGNRLATGGDYRVVVSGAMTGGRAVRWPGPLGGTFAIEAAHRYRTRRGRTIRVVVRDDGGAELRLSTKPKLGRY